MPWRGDPVSRQLPRLAPGDATPGLHRNGTAGSGAGVVRREVCRGHPTPKSNCAKVLQGTALDMANPGGAVLITRPEPGAAETARRVAALGWRPILAPALVLAPRPFAAPPAQALLLTSRAAARALPPSDSLVLAVGEATAAEARARGFA